MTQVAVALSRRSLPTHTNPDPETVGAGTPVVAGPTSLATLRPGRPAVVTGYAPQGPPATLRRLMDLGFGLGEPVDVVRRAPLGDPVVYRIAGYEVALRRTESRLILVRES